MSCDFAAGVDEVNLGGGGGGSMVFGGGGGKVLGGGAGIPLDDGWTNFLGAGIVDTFFTPKSPNGLLGFKDSDSWNELDKNNPSLISQYQ